MLLVVHIKYHSAETHQRYYLLKPRSIFGTWVKLTQRVSKLEPTIITKMLVEIYHPHVLTLGFGYTYFYDIQIDALTKLQLCSYFLFRNYND